MKIYQSLFILTNTFDNISYLSEIMHDHNLTFLDPEMEDEKPLFHYMALFKHSIMETCSFMEEYQENFGVITEVEYNDRIRQLKLALKPVTKKINEWSDLKKIRNELIAHPWRSMKGNEFTYSRIFSYNSPRNYWQLQVLRKYLTMIIGLIEAEFKIELQEVPVYMNSIKPQAVPPVNDPAVFDEMRTVVEEVNRVCKEQNKGYMLLSEKIVG